MRYTHLLFAASAFALLGACQTIPEEPPAEPVNVVTGPVETCVQLSSLRRLVIPAVTKTVIAITEIENPPYEPIQRREEQTRVVTPEQVIYVDDNNREVTDICTNDPVTPETMDR